MQNLRRQLPLELEDSAKKMIKESENEDPTLALKAFAVHFRAVASSQNSELQSPTLPW